MKKILIYNSGGGLGDSIQLFSLILSLQANFKSSELYYISAHENHFSANLKEFGIKIKTLDLKLKFFGFRWWHLFRVPSRLKKLKIDKFDLIIDLQSKIRNTLILKKIFHIDFYSTTFNFLFCSRKNEYISNNNLVDATIKNLEIFLEEEINKVEYNINDIPEKFNQEAKRLLPNDNYIGFSISQGNMYRKKSWSIDKFIELAIKIKLKNKIPVFFIKKDELNLINKIKAKVPNAIIPEINSNISCPALVTALAIRLDRAITIDNGIMHMLSLSNTNLTVLFGPTNSKKFAPSKNTIILDSKEIYNSNDINKIGVDEVYRTI